MDINKIHERITERVQTDEKLQQEMVEAYDAKKRLRIEDIVREQLIANNVLRISCKDFDKIVQEVLNSITVR